MKALATLFGLCISTTVSMAALLSDGVKQAISRSDVADSQFIASREDFLLLKEFSRESWRQFLPRLGELGLDERDQRKLLLATIEALPDEEYLPFVSQSLRLYANGQLPMAIGEDFIFPYKSNKEGFLAMNYQEQELASALRAALPRLSKNPDVKPFVERVLSGAAMRRYVERMLEQGLPPRPPVMAAAAASPSPIATTPNAAPPSPPVPTAKPMASSPAPTVTEIPAPVVERKLPLWPWLVGILALVLIVAFALKRERRKGSESRGKGSWFKT